MKPIRVALSPELNLDAEAFVDAWNEFPASRDVSKARVEAPTGRQFDPLIASGLAVLGSVATGLLTSVLYDLIKQTLARKGVHKETEITQLKQPDGTELLVVKIKEGK
jgi:hypothetical protein